MSLPDSTPAKLPKWSFLLIDAVLIGVAAFVAANSERPLSVTAILAIVGCVALGAIVTSLAFIADYVRKQETAFDDRQHALEALSRTVATSAEQISIAANGLNELTELTHKNLKQAEQLPHKLQEKINEFTRRLNEATSTENEQLQQEINALRASEAEKLETAGDKITKAIADLAKLEAATAKHVGAANETLAKLPDGLGKARQEAEQALQAAQTRMHASVEVKLAELNRLLDEKLAAISAAAAQLTVPPAPLPPANEVTHVPFSLKPAAPTAVAPVVVEEVQQPVETPPEPAPSPEIRPEPAPEPVIAESVAVATESPVNSEPAAAEPPPAAPSVETPVAAEAATEAKPPKKPRAPRKPKAEEPVGELLLTSTDEEASATATADDNEFSQVAPDEATPAKAVSTDGATRLLVTAYIGIGNRLFIRGDGPGLSWEKGVPLQFVSIGKWRWETSEATATVRAKLYKNDEIECASLGELSLDSGHQAEVTATF